MSPSVDIIARNIAIITTILTGLMVFEYFRFLSKETKLIWPRFWKTAESKIFVATRYPGLAGQGFNVWFAFRMALGVPNSLSTCRAWSLYQAVMTQCLLLSVESLLMLRVYKMYNKGKSMFALLFIFSGVQLAAMVANARLIVTGTSYSPTCVIISPHHSRIYVGASIIVTFVFILVAMLWRFFGSTSGSEALPPWLQLAVRDGSCTTIAITVIVIFMFLCNTRVIDTQMHGNVIFYVLLSFLWFAAGRLVLHQEMFREIQEFQDGDTDDTLASQWTETIEVDLNDITSFDDSNVRPMSPSGSEVGSPEVYTAFDSLSDAETRDITDEHVCEWEEDNAPLTSCTPAFMLIERYISGEGSDSTT